MALYFVSYDLRKARNYQALYGALASLGATRVLESVWCFTHPNTNCAAVRDHLAPLIDADDGLLVTDARAWAGRKLDGDPPTQWA